MAEALPHQYEGINMSFSAFMLEFILPYEDCNNWTINAGQSCKITTRYSLFCNDFFSDACPIFLNTTI